MSTFLYPITFPDGEIQASAAYLVPTLGFAGTVPASTVNDTGDFAVAVPIDCTLVTLRAVCKTATVTTTVFTLRRSTDGGATFTALAATVTMSGNSGRTGVTTGLNIDLTAGDVLQFSVTAGGGSGTNPMVEAICKPR